MERLYDALERGSFSSEELAPRIRKLLAKKEELESAKRDIEYIQQARLAKVPDLDAIRKYVHDIKSLLGSSPIFEQQAFLKAFVKDILVGAERVMVNYALPMPSGDGDEEVIGVLPFVKKSEPRRTRTSNRLIK